MHGFARWLVLGLVFASASRVTLAQDTAVAVRPPPSSPPDTLRRDCGFCNRPQPVFALIEGLFFQAANNRFNAWVRKDSTAYVTRETWKANLKGGWGWDQDNFLVNMLGHPYAGSTHFAGARSNGMGFWASAPFTFFHSAVWELFGETTRPSLNDFVDTGLGGIALGEMFHRFAATIRNNEAGGGDRFIREVAALPFDPVGTFNRILRGEVARKGPNPREHNPSETTLRIGGGAGLVRAPGSLLVSLKDAEKSAVFFADLNYGNLFSDSTRRPFDAFTMRIVLQPQHGGLTQLVGEGRIVGARLGGSGTNRTQLDLNQRFEYLNNGALQWGGQTLELGFASQLKLVGGFSLRTLLAGDGIVLAGINAPGAGTGEREYDFGPGLGGSFTAGIYHRGVPYLTARYQPAWIHTLDGAEDANHYMTYVAAELALPVLPMLQLVAHTSYHDRLSKYADGSRSRRRFPELRVFAALKTTHRRD